MHLAGPEDRFNLNQGFIQEALTQPLINFTTIDLLLVFRYCWIPKSSKLVHCVLQQNPSHNAAPSTAYGQPYGYWKDEHSCITLDGCQGHLVFSPGAIEALAERVTFNFKTSALAEGSSSDQLSRQLRRQAKAPLHLPCLL
jgi:hypothetical protein